VVRRLLARYRGLRRKPAFQCDLSFVSNDAVRHWLGEYFRQAVEAYNATSWAGSIALSGGVLEGLLTWAIEAQADSSRGSFSSMYGEQPPPVDQWKLFQLIEVASDLKLLGENARKTAWTVKDFRNMIHPYNALRTSWRPEERTARVMLDLVSLFTDSLARRVEE
jgi:hypothetical protein